ncbi:hypothetical protein PLICRDRAFT_39931 [Plicaturopsis crispa FD-325 SS-3]|nr:hypothetical protein PLICRDRAFT_39931 [Plicaturopsis crispa FD-325 SS-3]
MSLCANCIKGVRHEGTPTGRMETIGGVRCYVATPSTDYAKDKVVLFLTDVFGLDLNNNLLLMDDFASNGYKVVGPDYVNGDPIHESWLDGLLDGTRSIGPWLVNHTAAHTRPPLDAVIAALKAEGVTRFGATGYCLGGRYAFDLAFDNAIQVSVISHPSLLDPPVDLPKYRDMAKAPLLVNSCTIDQAYPLEAQKLGDDLLGDGKFAPGYARAHWEGCTHGFAVRGDLSDPAIKAGKEGAFKAAVEWFRKYL